ncbi:MAG: ribosome silencing factor [Chloroflexi bacterium]|nr:ribosome silencing factor [Chloroflexota bacterium]
MDLIASKMGADILLLDLQGLTLIADYFIIATAETERQLNAMSEEIALEVQKEINRSPLHIEGTAQGGWVLMDYGSVIVHLFLEKQRSYYDLEGLWNKARTVVRIA